MKHFMVIALLVLSTLGCCSSNQQDDFLRQLKDGVETLTTSSQVPDSLKKAAKTLKSDATSADTICKSCATVINNVILYRRTGASKISMIKYFKKLCRTFTDWGDVACDGYVEIEIDTALFIIDNKSNLTPERVCAIHFQEQKCVDPEAEPWDIPLPPPTSSITETSVTDLGSQPYNILQITDIHYDERYQPGSNAVCDEPLCCQSGKPANSSVSAGFWGDYNVCDMPWHSVEDLMHRVREKHKNISFVYFTGDIISHTSWNTSVKWNTESIKKIYASFAETFGNKKVYPVLGNHEPHPTDFYSPEDLSRTQVSTQWLFDLVAEEWSRWLPSETKSTIQRGGFYTVLVRPGFRIVGLNSNVCFTSNLWLIYTDVDPHGQLRWLVDVLLEAEKSQEKVHILSHIPPGEILCHKQWSHVFKKIINRFAKTISAQYNGHTHMDEFRVFYNTSNISQPINVAYNGGSFTSFVGFNPNYRIYQVNADNLMVSNYDQYIYDLGKANANTKVPPKWFKLYSFREAYGLPDLKFESFHTLLTDMADDTNLMKKYYKFMTRDSNAKNACDANCLKKLLCAITAVETNDAVNC